MKENNDIKLARLFFASCSVLAAVLLSLGFLLPHCGAFALVGFVPLLWADFIACGTGKKHFFWCYFSAFLLWNLITTFWVGGATVGGAAFAILFNTCIQSIVWALFRLCKRRFSGVVPYVFLAAAWIAWEKYSFSAQLSWPWLTLGNAFAYSPASVQWYEVTGLLGGSLWVWLCNLAVFGISFCVGTKTWKDWRKSARVAAVSAAVLIFAGPLAASWIRYATYDEISDEGSIDVCCVQPNFDPYEKYEGLTQRQQDSVILSLMDPVLQDKDSLAQLLILTPETCVRRVILNEMRTNTSLNTFKAALREHPNANMIVGATTYDFTESTFAPSYTARTIGNDLWYEDHNSALMIDATPRIEVYHKSYLVVGTEKMPWPRFFSWVEKKLGGTIMGHCTGQRHVSLLNFKRNAAIEGSTRSGCSIPLGCAICYESVHPEHFASYVRHGASAMTVITNDSWWGDTPGYRQHANYARLRAIETRRDIARCANSGVSEFVNQRGDVISQTAYWTRTTLQGKVNLNFRTTPFVRHGDVVGRLSILVFALIAFALLTNLIMKRKSR